MTTTDIARTVAAAITGSVGTRWTPGSSADPVLDDFARRAGPDVAFDSGAQVVRVFAIFIVDPETNRIRVRVMDDAGRLIRMIPPETVGEMIAAMAGYGG